MIQRDTAFVLSKPIDNVPAGATGQLKKPDSYHVTLTFDNRHYDDLVFDVYDTDPSVWVAIDLLPYSVGPSMPDPPSRCLAAAAAAIAILTVINMEDFPCRPLAEMILNNST